MNQKTVLCYGDSNTWGYDPIHGCRYDRSVRWPGVLKKGLGREYDVIEEGLCGRTTVWDDPIDGYNGLTHLTPILHSHAPLDLVVIMLGTNDLKSRFSLSPLDIAWSIGRLVDTVKNCGLSYTGPVPETLVVCPPPLGSMETSLIRDIFLGAEEKSYLLGKVMVTYCQEKNIDMINAGDFLMTTDTDGVHLEAAQHDILGKAIATKILDHFA